MFICIFKIFIFCMIIFELMYSNTQIYVYINKFHNYVSLLSIFVISISGLMVTCNLTQSLSNLIKHHNHLLRISRTSTTTYPKENESEPNKNAPNLLTMKRFSTSFVIKSLKIQRNLNMKSIKMTQ